MEFLDKIPRISTLSLRGWVEIEITNDISSGVYDDVLTCSTDDKGEELFRKFLERETKLKISKFNFSGYDTLSNIIKLSGRKVTVDFILRSCIRHTIPMFLHNKNYWIQKHNIKNVLRLIKRGWEENSPSLEVL